jgi:hypothetical protein
MAPGKDHLNKAEANLDQQSNFLLGNIQQTPLPSQTTDTQP